MLHFSTIWAFNKSALFNKPFVQGTNYVEPQSTWPCIISVLLSFSTSSWFGGWVKSSETVKCECRSTQDTKTFNDKLL